MLDRNNDDGWQAGILVREGSCAMNFDVEEVRAVFFRCKACRTAVSFPRIRWANLPERCPNCGTAWLKEPASEIGFPEETSTRAFNTVKSFRDALQALISASRLIPFTVGFETGETGDAEEAVAKPAGSSVL